jgi:hypothetical protein
VVLSALLGAALSPKPAAAQPSRQIDGRPRTVAAATAVRAQASPVLDGRLDDPAWRTAPVIGDFTQVEPNDGAAPTERTEVRVAYDRDALYIGARMFDSEPDRIASRLARRDDVSASDIFRVAIDSYHDHRTAFKFLVNPAGVRLDELAANDEEHGDTSWDPVWAVATRIDSLGWVAEIRIPFSQLRFSASTEQQWGINFSRVIFRKGERVRWSWARNTEQGYASLFGHLTGLQDIPQPRRVEVLPYTTARADFDGAADASNPFNDGSVGALGAGLDLKYGLTSGLTLDATLNPDFGQVEVDPAVVNLTAYETYFDERRPFFVEGANLFRFGAGSGGFVFGAPELFYSRRVGKAPSRVVSEDGGYVDNPAATSILGAAKLSGKTAGWSVGALEAVTGREMARVQRADGARWEDPVEPLASYSVVSLRRDFRGGATGVGALATGVHRAVGEDVFEDLRGTAYSAGADFFHRFANNQWAVSGTVSGSRIHGEAPAILAAQRSSARYYQRPDQSYALLDSTATSMSGYATSLQFGKVAGNWVVGTDFFAYSPGFEVNDAGFAYSADRIFHGVRLTRRWLDPGRVFRWREVDATWAQSWNFGGVRRSRSAYLGFSGELLNYWSLFASTNIVSRGLDDSRTRGGPMMVSPASRSVGLSLSSDPRKRMSVGLRGYYVRNEYEGWASDAGAELTARPTSAVEVSASLGFDQTHAVAFYVDQAVDPTATATYGGRYLFATLDQKNLTGTFRASVALSPELTIQWYVQPLVATGDYGGFKELARTRSFDFLRYGLDEGSTLTFDEATNSYGADPDGGGPAEPIEFDNPDFRLRSLLSNLVLRWEYVPGSTLFLVWNHGSSGDSTDPTFRAFRDLREMFGDTMRNTFVVKVSYWLSR